MVAIVNFLSAMKAKFDRWYGLTAPEDDNESIDEVNWKLLEDSFQRAAYASPEIEPKE